MNRNLFVRASRRRFQGSKCIFRAGSNFSNKEGPLEGIKILDLSRILAGPFGTMVLGDLGAEVIKVERPKVGDDTRFWGPPYLGEESCYFFSVNRNKKSIAIDLKNPKGIEIIKELAKTSDVLVENFVPGMMDKYGLGYETLRKIAPRLVYSSVSGYGSSGPYHKRQGYDVLAASVGGLLGVTGTKDGEPCKVGVAMTDLATGLYLHGAIMAALIERQKTKMGQKIDCNLLSTQVSCMVNLASNYLNAGTKSQKWGTEHESIVPYQAFKTKDGHMTIGSGNDPQFINLCRALGLEELIKDKRFMTNASRVQHREILIQILQDRFLEKTNKQWLQIFEGKMFAYGQINTIEETFADPQVLHNNMVQELQHTTAGSIKVVGPAVQYSMSSNFIRSAPPVLGEHTREVMKSLGYSTSEIDALQEQGIIQ